MVRRGKKSSKGLANKSHTSVVPLSPEERSVLDKVSACPILRVPIQRLRPSTGHARLHGDAKIIGLVAAIRRFGFVEPILVDQDFTIISGMARWMACQEMGVAEVPVKASYPRRTLWGYYNHLIRLPVLSENHIRTY